MSYILDALNKSEQERRGQQTPDLQTVHRAPPAKTGSKFPVLAVVAVFALINAVGIGYFLYDGNSAFEPAAPVNANPLNANATSTSSGNPDAVNTSPIATTPPIQPNVQRQAQTGIQANQTSGSGMTRPDLGRNATGNTEIGTGFSTDFGSGFSNGQSTNQDILITPETAFQKPSDQAVRITELPVNVQRQIPDLEFSSHLYSDEASFRMVNINGQMRREGDMIASNLKLLEISEEGVVLGFRHYVFEVSVLRDWSFN